MMLFVAACASFGVLAFAFAFVLFPLTSARRMEDSVYHSDFGFHLEAYAAW